MSGFFAQDMERRLGGLPNCGCSHMQMATSAVKSLMHQDDGRKAKTASLEMLKTVPTAQRF